MRQLNGVYTQLSNRAHSRVGHVFQGRFKAIVVDKDNYLLELARYVVLNPVRAGMVGDVCEWPWSSYSAMIAPSNAEQPEWLATDKLLAYFAVDPQTLNRKQAQQRYIQHVRDGVGLPSVWEALSSQVFLGDEKFVNKMLSLVEKSSAASKLEIPQAQRRAAALPLQAYEHKHRNDRNAAIQAAFASGGYTMAQLAEYFGIHYTSVSRIVKAT